jgi:hypothetical protein
MLHTQFKERQLLAPLVQLMGGLLRAKKTDSLQLANSLGMSLPRLPGRAYWCTGQQLLYTCETKLSAGSIS